MQQHQMKEHSFNLKKIDLLNQLVVDIKTLPSLVIQNENEIVSINDRKGKFSGYGLDYLFADESGQESLKSISLEFSLRITSICPSNALNSFFIFEGMMTHIM